MIEMAIFNGQRSITPKVCNPELRFLCSARRLISLNICVKNHENVLICFEVTKRTRVCGKNAIFQCSKGNNSDRMRSRDTFLRSARVLSSLTFVRGFMRITQTVQISKGNNSIRLQSRVMVHVLCTLSYGA